MALSWTALTRRARPAARPGCRRPPRLLLEQLEDRVTPTTVTNLNDAGAGSLRDAFNATATGGTIDFAPGLSGAINLTSGPITSSKTLTVTGPGPDLLAVNGASNGTRGLFDFTNAPSVTLSGLTVENATYQSTSGFAQGGAVFANRLLVVSNCAFLDNLATSPNNQGAEGGAIYLTGTLTATDTLFCGNLAVNSRTGTTTIDGTSDGGAISSTGAMTLTRCTFEHNQAFDPTPDGSSGGAIEDLFGTSTNPGAVNATGCAFLGNGAGDGGAVLAAGRLNLNGCLFLANGGNLDAGGTPTVGAKGGALYAINGGLTFSGTTVTLTQTVSNTTFAVNTAEAGGALFANNFLGLTLSGTTLAGNTAVYGGGAFQDDTSFGPSSGLTIRGSTVTGNQALADGGGVLALGGRNGPVVLQDSVVAGNTAGPAAAPTLNDFVGTVQAVRTPLTGAPTLSNYNLIGSSAGLVALATSEGSTQVSFVQLDDPALMLHNQVGSPANPLDARLSTILAPNGGPALGAPAAPLPQLTVAVLANSPARAAGDPALAGTTDANGVTRSATPNVGAVEYVPTVVTQFVLQGAATASSYYTSATPDYALRVVAADQYGNRVTTYTGTVTFSDDDPTGSDLLFDAQTGHFGPADGFTATFTAGNAGELDFVAYFGQPSPPPHTLTVSDGVFSGTKVVTVNP
jgi:hypothetical protein